jgi:hypothetical protein
MMTSRPRRAKMHRRSMRALSFIALALALAGCKSSQPSSSEAAAPTRDCREGVGDDVKTAGRTAGAGAKTGIVAAGDGMVQAGSSVAGLVHGGTDEAKQHWKEGGKETKANARKGADETRAEANVPRCTK